MIVRHALGFLTLTFFVVVATKSEPMRYKDVMGLSALFYVWFLLSTRMSMKFWSVFILLIGSVYLIHLYQSNLTSDRPTAEERAKFDQIKLILTAVAGVLTVIGFGSYYVQKRVEYGSKFRHETFLLGTPVCKGESPDVGFFNSLRGIFTR